MLLKQRGSLKIVLKIVSLVLVLIFGLMGLYAAMPSPVLALDLTTVLSNLSSPTINCGSTPTVIGGNINAGIGVFPPGNVSITLNGVTQTASINTETGNFSSSFNTGALACGPYTITYNYAGLPGFAPVSGTGTLTVPCQLPPVLSNLSSPTINCGSTPTTIGGNIKSGLNIPPGNVSITLNGVTQVATIDSGNGNFSFSFNTGALTCGAYTISYNYAGTTCYIPAAGTGTLTVPCQLPPVLSNLSSPIINCGIPTVAISGNIKSGIYIPPGNVSITLNGVVQVATIDTANGDFTFSFNTSGLACCGSYTISYSYAGTTCYIPASAAGTLTVRCPTVPPPEQPSSSPVILELFGNSLANMVVTNLNVQPPQAQVTQPVTIYANIANRGDESGSYTATLKINDVVEETKTGKVGGHAAVPLQFTILKDKPGTYNVDINGQQTSFVIVDDGGIKPSIATKDWALVGFSLSAISVIIVLALLLRRRLADY